MHIRERLLQYNQDLMYGDIVWTIVPIVILNKIFVSGEADGEEREFVVAISEKQ